MTLIGLFKITAIMVTHNMEHALTYGNRLLMMHKEQTIVGLDQRQRQDITVSDLLAAFERASGERLAGDSILLSTPKSTDNNEIVK